MLPPLPGATETVYNVSLRSTGHHRLVGYRNQCTINVQSINVQSVYRSLVLCIINPSLSLSFWTLQLAYDPVGLAAKYGVDFDVDVDVDGDGDIDGLDGDSCDSYRHDTKGEVPFLAKDKKHTSYSYE